MLDEVGDGEARREPEGLREVARAVRRNMYLALVRAQFAQHEPEQSGLAGPVDAGDEVHPGRELRVHALEHEA